MGDSPATDEIDLLSPIPCPGLFSHGLPRLRRDYRIEGGLL